MSVGKIYKITNNINNKIYIGCTINTIDQRFSEHKSRCKTQTHKSKLYNSFRKYGVDNFSIELIEECDINIMYELEQKYILENNALKDGLNNTAGGEGCIGYKHTEESRKNLKGGLPFKDKTYEEIYGIRHNDEKEKRRESVKNNWLSYTEEERKKRVDNIRIATQKKSKLDIGIIKEIKEKIKMGAKNKELKKQYPDIRYNLFSELRHNRRWKNI